MIAEYVYILRGIPWGQADGKEHIVMVVFPWRNDGPNNTNPVGQLSISAYCIWILNVIEWLLKLLLCLFLRWWTTWLTYKKTLWLRLSLRFSSWMTKRLKYDLTRLLFIRTRHPPSAIFAGRCSSVIISIYILSLFGVTLSWVFFAI